MDAEPGQVVQGQVYGRVHLGPDLRAEAAAEVVQFHRLDSYQQEVASVIAEQGGQGRDLLEAGLMQAHLPDAQKARDLLGPLRA